MEDFFKEIISNTKKYKVDNFKNCIFYKKNDNVICVADYSNKYLWVNYDIVWSVCEKKYNLSYKQVEEKIKIIINNYKDWENLIPNGRMRNKTI